VSWNIKYINTSHASDEIQGFTPPGIWSGNQSASWHNESTFIPYNDKTASLDNEKLTFL
jgi:hypothetical protein